MIKNILFNKTKNPRVRFFIYMSSMCVQLFTVFEVAVLTLYVYIGECPKIQDGHHLHGKEPRKFFYISVAAT